MELKHNFLIAGWHVFPLEGPAALTTRHATVSITPPDGFYSDGVLRSYHFRIIRDEDADFVISNPDKLTNALLDIVDSIYGLNSINRGTAKVVITRSFFDENLAFFPVQVDGLGQSVTGSHRVDGEELASPMVREEAEITDGALGIPVHKHEPTPHPIRANLDRLLPDGTEPLTLLSDDVRDMLAYTTVKYFLVAVRDSMDSGWNAMIVPYYESNPKPEVTEGDQQYMVAQIGTAPGHQTYMYEIVGESEPKLVSPSSFIPVWIQWRLYERLLLWKAIPKLWEVKLPELDQKPEPLPKPQLYGDASALVSPGVKVIEAAVGVSAQEVGRIMHNALPIDELTQHNDESRSKIQIELDPNDPDPETTIKHLMHQFRQRQAAEAADRVRSTPASQVPEPQVGAVGSDIEEVFESEDPGHFTVFVSDDSPTPLFGTSTQSIYGMDVHIHDDSPLRAVLPKELEDFAGHKSDIYYIVYQITPDRYGVVEVTAEAIAAGRANKSPMVPQQTNYEQYKFVFVKPAFRSGLYLRRPEAEPLLVPKPRQVLHAAH